jgi:hypothetical protein
MQDTMKTTRQYRYEIDENDRIVDVDDAWLEFARNNGAGWLTRDSVIGEPLDSFIIGWRAIDLYAYLIALLRSSGKAATLPFRCDTPHARRDMVLEIAPLANGHVRFTGRLEREQPHPPIPLLDPELARSEQKLPICSFCLRIQPASGEWEEIESALEAPYASPASGLPQLGYEVLPRLH